VADVLAVACSPYAEAVKSYNAVDNRTQTAIMEHASDVGSQGCFVSGMDVINMFGYKPVSTIIINSAKRLCFHRRLVSVFVC